MNRHLNLFHFYNENTSFEFLENNLSRAFSLTLLNSSIFFNEFIKSIVSEEDYDYLFSTYSKESSFFEIDIQIDISLIEQESFKNVYAVALTSNDQIDFSDFFDQKTYPGKNITDIIITIKDILLVIEVKKHNEDCKRQLYNQVFPFIQRHSEGIIVQPICKTWQEIVNLMEKVHNLERVTSFGSSFLRDFLRLAEVRRPNWFQPKPFNSLKFSTKWGSTEHHHLMQRLKQALSNCKDYSLLDYSDRLGLAINFNWASEVIPYFHRYENDQIKNYIVFNIWPGNTKSQGYHFYNKSMDWINKKTLLVDDLNYDLEIVQNIKICHFNRYVTGLNYYEDDLLKSTHTVHNFHHKSGKWNIQRWPDFEIFMDEHFKPEYNWREKCQWDKYIIDTDRTYFTMSLGFEVSTFVPYQEFCDIDKKAEDIKEVSLKIDSIVLSLKKLID
ncbi:hypothetical protein [Flavobacterium hydrophilum]|uniref:PD-(D/E)XK nuclease superfamily protein n=1 Tax=Flavobacterium hydrophilum TaxID=2211445 RepID=A0A2V4C0F2_9FLAO|nr:hypothetical protein [Flavobacterium hydrophilum]PXY44729.1 hypothetical protein DMB68_14845 [Flavobacterium hydrophilum]